MLIRWRDPTLYPSPQGGGRTRSDVRNVTCTRSGRARSAHAGGRERDAGGPRRCARDPRRAGDRARRLEDADPGDQLLGLARRRTRPAVALAAPPLVKQQEKPMAKFRMLAGALALCLFYASAGAGTDCMSRADL